MVDHQRLATAMGCAHYAGRASTEDDRLKIHMLRMACIVSDGKSADQKRCGFGPQNFSAALGFVPYGMWIFSRSAF